MSVTAEPKYIDEYLIVSENFNINDDIDGLIKYIENESSQKKFADSDLFFEAEKSFFIGEYDNAHTKYLQAREVPYYEFFCYRATAFVSYQKQDHEKALAFIDKALQMRPNDYSTLKLSLQIHEANQDIEAAKKIEEKINNLTKTLEIEKSPTENMNEHLDETTDFFIAKQLGVDINLEKELEERLQTSINMKTSQIEKYLKIPRQNKTDFLYSHCGFNNTESKESLIQDQLEKSSYGLFLMWKNQGIVINPGRNFIENFHKAGFSILDITHVIVTSEHNNSFCDIQKIYDLNYQINKFNPEVHVIKYWLNQKSYQKLASDLKPNFKQERNSVHSLELFLDSSDVEKEELSPEITLSYFATISKNDFQGINNNKSLLSLGIKLDLQGEDKNVTLGYVSKTPWSPIIANSMGHTDILITGFGKTNPSDYGKLNYIENSLGYFGTYTLLEEIKPKMLLCSEFEGSDGDIRLEVIRKLRKEFLNSAPENTTTILPLESDLFLDLRNLLIKCSISDTYLKPEDVQVVKSKDSFGHLLYLSPKCIL